MARHSVSSRILLAGLSSDLYGSLRGVASRTKDVEWVVTVPSLEEAIEASADASADVILLEVPLPKPSHYSLIRDCSGHPAHPAIVAVSRVQEEAVLYDAFSIGATAFVTFDTPPEFIMSAIQRVCKGERPIEYAMYAHAGMTRHLLREMWELRSPAPAESALCPLSQRELDILSSIARGCASKEIASMLGIREQTIKNYVSGILRKLDVYDRVQAVVLALQNKWILFG